VAVDASGNVYVGETANDRIQMVSPAGVVTTLAGSKGVTGSADGAGNLALFYFPRGVAVDPFGNVYVADSQNSTIRKGTSIAPIIGTPPSSFAVVAGSASTLSVGASGSTALTYQWYFNGQPISGATNASYSISSTQVANSGSYTVVATNAAGSATSPTAMLTVSAASGGPAITSQPASQTIATGSTVVFSVNSSGIVQSSSSSSSDGPRADARLQADASGTSATYQWYLNGAPIAGAANAILVVQATANSAGAYTCLVSNSNGSVLSDAATLSVTNTPPNPGRLVNLSTLAVAGSGSQTLTVGFFVGGSGATGSQSLLVQALGPTVSTMGVSGVMPDPQLNLFSGQTVIGANCGWGCTPGNQQAVSAADAATYATALADPASKDSAVVVPLAPGGYTAQVNSVSGVTGKTLTAFYDDTPSGTYGPTTPRLINLSCRLLVGSNSSLTAGFWIGGTTAKTVLIRADGPALAAQNITGVMPDPQLTVYNSADAAIAYNAGWGGSSVLSSVAASVYAQPFTDPNSKDSEVLLTLAPGGYTAQVSSAGNTAGNVMIEVYEVP
jgi:hypothetical protein